MESKINILKIKEQLPHGAQSEIARKLQVSIPHVNHVLNGSAEDLEVFNAIADYLSDFRQQKNKAISRLASLID